MPFATQWHAKHKLKFMGFWLIGHEIAMQRHRVHAPFPINISRIINAFATQCHEYCCKFSMNEPLKMIIPNLQRRRVHAAFSINISEIINVFATQCHEYCGKFSKNESLKMMIPNLQRRRVYANIPMNVFYNINILMVQLGTSCSFDSPGLARDEPTLGKRLQGDSTL